MDKGKIQRVAIDFMNAAHDEEVDMINALDALIARAEAGENLSDQIQPALDAFLSHTEQHFANENQLMQETGFHAYPMHSGEHERILNDMRTTFSAWSNNQDHAALGHFIRQTHPDWMSQHIASMDFVTAKFAADQRNAGQSV